ncbi:MAG: flavodoxin family protein [Christensenellales bacterium]|jgi:multimeric flavodoxin WrbA
MKVLLVNGSPHPAGCTYTALMEIAGALEREGIDAELFQAGRAPMAGCAACGGCGKRGRCALPDAERVNALIQAAQGADGFIFGSPVHYASADGTITSLLDRAFYAGGAAFTHKPGAAVVSCRRAGSTAALDQLNKYLTINQMPVVSSQYWNMVHGNTPDQVRQDAEGLQIMRTLGRNMAWLLKCIQAGAQAGVKPPEREQPRQTTNFIR